MQSAYLLVRRDHQSPPQPGSVLGIIALLLCADPDSPAVVGALGFGECVPFAEGEPGGVEYLGIRPGQRRRFWKFNRRVLPSEKPHD